MILGISGGRSGGNTDALVRAALEECAKAGMKTEFVNLLESDKEWKEDAKTLELLKKADGVIVGSPTYFANPSARLVQFFERSLPLRRQDFALRNKVGGAIAVGGSRNGGQEQVIHAIQSWMLIHDMVIVGDSRPTAHFGGIGMARNPGEADTDEKGMETSRNLGKKVAEVVKLIKR